MARRFIDRGGSLSPYTFVAHRESWVMAELEALFDRAVERRPSLAMAGLREIMAWSRPLEGDAWARLLMAQLNDTDDPELAVACAEQIAGSEAWETLVTELVRLLPPTPSTIKAFARVVSVRASEHPVAAYAAADTILVCPAFDGPLDNDSVVIRTPLDTVFATNAPVLLLSVEAPLTIYGYARVISSFRGRLTIEGDPGHPLQPENRATLEPCLVLQPV